MGHGAFEQSWKRYRHWKPAPAIAALPEKGLFASTVAIYAFSLICRSSADRGAIAHPTRARSREGTGFADLAVHGAD